MPEASPSLPSAPRQGDPLTVLLYLLMLVVVLAYVLEFVGAKRGWMERVLAHWSSESVPEGVQAIAPPSAFSDLKDLGSIPAPAMAGAADGQQQLYQRLYEEALGKLSVPQVGRQLTLHRANGEVLTGEVREASASHMVLALGEGSQAQTVRLGMVDLASSDWAVAFPENIATMQAVTQMAAMGSVTAPPASGTGASSPPPTGKPHPTSLPEISAVTPASPARATDGYDVTPRASSPELKVAVQEFGQWLEMQQRRMGAALAKQAWASQDDQGRAVLYLRTASAFNGLDATARQQLTETIWRFWAMRCRSHGQIQRNQQAHLVWLAADGDILGGSKPADGSQLWVKP
jgi:hypothetical protein